MLSSNLAVGPEEPDMFPRLVLCCMAIAASAQMTCADVAYQSSTRWIRASAGVSGTVSPVISASGFEQFDESVEIYGPNPDGYPDSYGHATQFSRLGFDEITVNGVCEGYDAYPSGGVGSGAGRSVFDVVFEYAGTDAQWSFYADANSGRVSRTQVRFERLSPSPQLFVSGDTAWLSGPWMGSGDMTPGTYRLWIDVLGGEGGFGTGSHTVNYAAILSIPCPGCAGLFLAALARRRR